MQSTYHAWLVALSLIVATLASYTALDLADRISLVTYARARHAWLAGGAVAMGIGIWSMHFIGMLSFSLSIPIGYDLLVTCYSLAIAILVSGFALYAVTRKRLSVLHLLAGGVLMGLGIASMHYTGMAAMLMRPGIQYDPKLVVASLIVAIAASTAALWVANTLRGAEQSHVMPKRIGAACVMGFAIAGMHYMGMAAANFLPGSICGAVSDVKPLWLAGAVIPFAFAILIATLMLSRLDARATFLASSVARLNDQIDRMARSDALTGLPNRTTLTERIDHALRTSVLNHTVFAVLFVGIDDVHNDEVLKVFAARLRSVAQGVHMVASWDNEQFVMLLENLPLPRDAEVLTEAILAQMNKSDWDDGQSIHTVPYIGVACFPRDGMTSDTLLANAQTAMHDAQNSGGGTIRFFETVPHA